MPKKLKWKFEKIVFEIWIEMFCFWPTEGNEKKLKYAMKIWNENIWKLSLKFEMKISIWNLKKKTISPKGNEKNLKWWNHIFRLGYRDKNSNNTLIPPMYTALYHRCKLWWDTINITHRILSYWSFFNSGIGGMVHRKEHYIFQLGENK
jgi:hypothetical protein